MMNLPCLRRGRADRHHFFSALLVVLIVTASSLRPAAAQTTGKQLMHGHVPPGLSRLKSLGQLSGATNLQLAIGLSLRNAAALTNLLRQIYDPASTNYHRYLTPAQFTERFGPTENDYQAMIAFAQANGLKVTATHPNRVVLDVSGSVASVEKALHVTLRVYQHPTEARTFYAPDTEPSLDLSVPILHISGLDNYALPHPHLQATPAEPGAKKRAAQCRFRAEQHVHGRGFSRGVCAGYHHDWFGSGGWPLAV
jgi:subtilase family serine protease